MNKLCERARKLFPFSHAKTAISFNILLVLLILYLRNTYIFRSHITSSYTYNQCSSSSSSSSSSCNLQRALEPIAKMNLCVCLARMPMKATGFAVGVSRARPWTAPSSWLEQQRLVVCSTLEWSVVQMQIYLCFLWADMYEEWGYVFYASAFCWIQINCLEWRMAEWPFRSSLLLLMVWRCI